MSDKQHDNGNIFDYEKIGPDEYEDTLRLDKLKLPSQPCLPSASETAVITAYPKLAALCFDRVWSPFQNVVPDPVRCWGATEIERSALGVLALLSMVLQPYEAKTTASVDGLVSIDLKRSQPVRMLLSKVFSTHHQLALTPIYDGQHEHAAAYPPGEELVVLSVIENLHIVDEARLSWDQVLEFRNDLEAKRKYRRLLHWISKDLLSQSQAYIQDEIEQRLEDYEWAIKKHGLETLIGFVQETLDGKFLTGLGAIAGGLTLAGFPTLGLFSASGLIISKVCLKLASVLLDTADVRRGPNSEIAWIYDLKQVVSKELK